ncbi:hypothetical protein OUZ56_020274 [Daphnia magna]|uniref:GMP synthase n=1 Tax=Daphnia magna TaxID=35525 RepID=A0ABQ9ZE15_9CRUS|nr:hypothetical protein OUZ56_020274 [Daphnia magna]
MLPSLHLGKCKMEIVVQRPSLVFELSNVTRKESRELLSAFIVIYSRTPGPCVGINRVIRIGRATAYICGRPQKETRSWIIDQNKQG